MFILGQLRQELNRSKRIAKASNEASSEIRKQYEALDEKYNLESEKRKLEHIPRVRRAIVTNFLRDIKETEARLSDDKHNKELSKAAIQRFIGKIGSLNDNKKRSMQNA